MAGKGGGMIVGRIQEALDALEKEAACGVRSFDVAADALGKLLERQVRTLVDAHDVYTMPQVGANGLQAPFVEREHKEMDLCVAGILDQARALAFTRALLLGLRDREAAVRAEAFPT